MRGDPLTNLVRLAAATRAPALAFSTSDPDRRISIDPRDGSPLGGKPLFNLGSIAKTFTAAVLAHHVVNGSIEITSSIRTVGEAWLPDITFLALATHTSGLPREASKRSGSTLALDSEEALREAVTGTSLGSPGSYRYSNLGYLLLGHALERLSGRPLPTVARERLFEPLGMVDTRHAADLDGTQLVGVRVDDGTPVQERITVPGAGGFYGTADDLLRWARACACPPASVREVFEYTMRRRLRLGALTAVPETWNRPGRPGTRQIALAWRLEADGLVWHTGGTNGFTTFCAANRRTGSATVALLAAGIGALPDSPQSVPSAIKLLRLRGQLMQLAR